MGRSSFALLVMIAGCADVPMQEEMVKPMLLAISTSRISVGEPIEFVGSGFTHTKMSHTDIRFLGQYRTASGAVEPVDLRLTPRWSGPGLMTVPFFGPFQVPFSQRGDQLGTFEGTLQAINIPSGSAEVSSDPLPIHLSVGPSLVVRALQPIVATCREPAKRLLGGIPYELTVEAIGFKPVNFTTVLANLPGEPQPRILRHPATGNKETFGLMNQAGPLGNTEIIFPTVPEELHFYIATVMVSSIDTQGISHTAKLSFGVHRPIEYVPTGPAEVAEIEPPKPQSGCMSGGNTGLTVEYSETNSDTRGHNFTVHWDDSWMKSHSEGSNQALTLGRSEQNSNTNGSSTNWNRYFNWNVGASTSVSLPVIGKLVDVNGSYGQGGGTGGDRSQSSTVGQDRSVSDTESKSFEDSASQTWNKGQSITEEISSSRSITKNLTAQVLARTYAVFYRQATRLEYPGAIVAYDFCGATEYIANTSIADYAWAVQLAAGDACPPLPKSHLPEAHCYISPCNFSN